MDNNNNINTDQTIQPQVQPADQPVAQPAAQPVPAQPVYQQPYQQPVTQPVYQQMQPLYMNQQPYPSDKKITEYDLMTPVEKAARRKSATILCIISLALQFIPETISGFLTSVLDKVAETSSVSNISEIGSILISVLFGGSYIASWVLMIMARVKYKESKFAKVLMWVYIGILAAGILAVILIIATCAYIVKDCQGF